MFILASSVCKSLQCLICTLTQGSKGDHLFRLTCSVVLWGGRNIANKNITGVCGECLQCMDHTEFAPTRSMCAFQVYSAQAPRCSAREWSKVGPGLCALPRTMPLRFRFSGTPQRHKLGWACVLCSSQVRAAQAKKSLASALSPGEAVCLTSSPVPAALFPGCAAGAPSQVCHVSPLGS